MNSNIFDNDTTKVVFFSGEYFQVSNTLGDKILTANDGNVSASISPRLGADCQYHKCLQFITSAVLFLCRADTSKSQVSLEQPTISKINGNMPFYEN